jgi:hypothetical protein
MVRYIYLPVLIVLFFITAPFKSHAQVSGFWWLQSSMADSSKTLKIYASAGYSYSRMKGVISGKTNNGQGLLVLRKGIVTSYTGYAIDKMDMSLKSSVNLSYATKEQTLNDYLQVDIMKWLFFQGGMIWERNDAFLLKNRYSGYGGIGLTPSFFKTLKLKSLLAVGRVNQEYTIPVDNIDVIKVPYAAFYTSHDFQYTLSSKVSVTGNAHYFTNMGDLNRYRYGLSMNLRLNLMKHIKLIAGYRYNYDREYVLLGLMPDNSTRNFGIEVSL